MKGQYSAVKQTEKIVLVLKNALHSRGRFSTNNIAERTGLSKTSAQTIAGQLVKEGYLTSDQHKPQGFKATDKTKQLFWVAL